MKHSAQWQYQGKAEVVSTQPERTTPDKWHPLYYNPVLKKVLPIALIPFFFAPPSNSAIQNEINKYGFNKQTFYNPVLPEKSQWVYQSLFESPSPSAIQNEIVRYGFNRNTFDNPRLLKKSYWSYPNHFSAPDIDSQFLISKYEWRFSYRPPIKNPDLRWTYPSFFPDTILHVAPGIENVTLDKWYISPAPVPRRSWRFQERFYQVDPFSLTRGESITIDKWFRPASQPTFKKSDLRWTYPTFFPDAQLHEVPGIEIVTLDKWYVAPEPVPIKAWRFQERFYQIDPLQLTRSESITIDKWFSPASGPIRIPPFPLRTGILTADLKPIVTDNVTLDKWFIPSSIPRFDVTTNEFLSPCFIMDPRHLTDGESITLEKWFRQTSNPTWKKPRLTEYPHFSIDFKAFLSGSPAPSLGETVRFLLFIERQRESILYVKRSNSIVFHVKQSTNFDLEL